MRLPISLFQFFLVLITTLFSLLVGAQPGDLKAVFKLNKIDVETKEIKIRNGEFSVTIIVDEKPVILKAFGEPVIKRILRQTPLGVGEQTCYSWETTQGYKLSWMITKVENQLITIQTKFSNRSLKPVILKEFLLLSTPEDNFSVISKASEWMLTTTDVEARRWGTLNLDIPTCDELNTENAYSINYFRLRNETEKMKSRSWRCYLNDISLYTNPGNNGISFAAVDTVSDVYFDVKVKMEKMKLEIHADMSEIIVDPGEERRSDEVMITSRAWGAAQELRNKWIAGIAGIKVAKKPAFGWCSWYRTGTNVSEKEVLDITDYARKNNNYIPFEVIQIDDGWQISKSSWKENPKFQKGINILADSINSLGLAPGIWLSPAAPGDFNSESGNNKPFPPAEWYANFKTGKYFGDNRLDPTHPEVIDHIYKSLKYSYNKGYRYFKLDFSQIPFGSRRFYNQKLTRFQAQKSLFRLYRKAIGDDSYLLACGTSDQRALVPYIDADRIGTDCGPTKGFARGIASDNKPGDIHGLWFPILSMANKCYENGPLSNADPDVTYTGLTGECRPQQLRTFHSFVGILGGLALTSDKLYQKDFDKPDNLRMMELLYPVSEEKGRNFAGGWDMYGKQFGYLVNRSYGNSINVITWNPEHNGTADLTIKNVPVSLLGKRFHAWSFWAEEYKGIVDSTYKAKAIPKYEHELLRLTPITKNPVVIGSNLHISMGAAEIKTVAYSEAKITLELDANAGARNGRIYFYSEKLLSDATSTNSDAFIFKKQENIYVLVLTTRERNKKEIVTINVTAGNLLNLSNVTKDINLNEKYVKSSFTAAWEKSW